VGGLILLVLVALLRRRQYQARRMAFRLGYAVGETVHNPVVILHDGKSGRASTGTNGSQSSMINQLHESSISDAPTQLSTASVRDVVASDVQHLSSRKLSGGASPAGNGSSSDRTMSRRGSSRAAAAAAAKSREEEAELQQAIHALPLRAPSLDKLKKKKPVKTIMGLTPDSVANFFSMAPKVGC
jgi:hypothetical protein